MKIVEQTPNQVNNLMTPIGTILFASVFVAAGLAAMVFFGEVATLTCQRVPSTQGSCQFVRSRWLGSKKTTIPLNQLQSAKVDITASSKGDVYRVVLLTDGGKVPFTSVWSSGDEGKQENVDQINALSTILERHFCVFSKMIAGLPILLGELLFCLVVG